jgi:ectoine hydroxylase-related dioxygenase (phytanoyl-CoA dioxygenase family)
MTFQLIDRMEEIKNSVKNNGIYVLDKFLNEIEGNNLKEIILKNSYSKSENYENTYLSNLKSFLKNFYKINLVRKSITFNKLAKKYSFKKITNHILSNKTELRVIDAYVSKISKNPVLDWHVDQAYSGKKDIKNFVNPDLASIKFFIYLTDVDIDNGCLGYIPKSNRICYYLKKGILEKKIDYSPYWKLVDLRNKLMQKKTYDYIKNYLDNKLIDEFLEQSKFILVNGDTKKFDFKLSKGSLIIFDESGVHRGSQPSKNDRVVCRFHYKAS